MQFHQLGKPYPLANFGVISFRRRTSKRMGVRKHRKQKGSLRPLNPETWQTTSREMEEHFLAAPRGHAEGELTWVELYGQK